MQLAPSLHRIGSDLVNVYLIADDTGVTIVDAGLPGQWDELEPELAAMGRSLADVRAVILTHGDTDHIGFAERLHVDVFVVQTIAVPHERQLRAVGRKCGLSLPARVIGRPDDR